MENSNDPRMLSSATKHGFRESDILHALHNHIDRFEAQGAHELTIFIGPARDGSLLEIGVVEDEIEDRVIHTMRARKKYWPLEAGDHIGNQGKDQ